MLGAHSDTLVMVHVIWATRWRAATLAPQMDGWLAEMLGQKCSDLGCELLSVGNSRDHVHVVLRQAPSIALAEVVGRLKGSSSHAWNVRSPARRVHWQTGYWARSVEQASLDPLLGYVRDQRRRHGSGATSAAWEQHEATTIVS